MRPRTGKGPSWINEPQPQSRTPAKMVEEVDSSDNQMDVDPAPSQDALSDLEWMRQRMAKSIVDDSDTTATHLDPPPPGVADVNKVRLCG